MYTFSKTKQISQRFKNFILAALFALTQLVTPLTFSGIAGAANAPNPPTPPGNNGTVKVDGTDIDQLHDEDSHLGCTFNLNWFGYDKANGIDATVNFSLQAPTHGTGYTLNVAGDTTPTFDSPGGAVLDHSEQYTLSFTGTPQSQGYHVKLTVNTPHSKGNDEKHKVFWVEGCGQPPVVKPCTTYTQAGEVRPSNLMGFDFSQTRATGHYSFVPSGLHIWTEGSTSTDKVAAYKSVNVPLGDVGTPSLNYDSNFGIAPGYQLVMDFNHDGTPDGILVGETVYGNNWWLADGTQLAKDGAPHTGGGNGSPWYGTLNEWLAAFPDAHVQAFGFSLGSGVHADGVLKSITFACGVYKFTNDKGEIMITKDAQPNSLQDFSFTTTGTGLSNFTLDDDFGVPGGGHANSKTKEFDGLAAGTYTVTENTTPGWYLDSITCRGEHRTSVDGRTVTIQLSKDEHVSCTFTNKQLTKIIVHKVTDPLGDPTSFPVSISADRGEVVGDTTGSISSSSDATFWVKPGTYDVNETSVAGWKQVRTTCQNLVVSGEQGTKECTIYNEKLTGLTIIKDARPNSAKDFHFTVYNASFGGWPQYFDSFTLDDDGNPNNAHSNQQTYTDINPGQYIVFEQSEPGWTLEGFSCSEGTQYSQFFGALIVNVAKGQNPVCTFVNQQDTGSIRVVKHLYPASDAGKFNLNIDGQTSAAAVGDGGDTGYQTVYTGTHSVSETAAEGTSLSDYRSWYVCRYDNMRELAATNVQSLVQKGSLQTENYNGVITGRGTTVSGLKLNKNDHVTCTFTNKRIPTITIVKDAQPNSEQAFTFDTNFSKDFQLTDDGSQSGAEHQTFKVKNNKTYSFSEQTVNGWTLADVTCEGGNGESWGMDGGTLYVTPHWGDNIVCTFTNQKAAKVTIVKDAQPNSSQAFSFTSNLSGEDSMFALVDNGTNADLAKEVFTSVAPGTYTVKETSLLGWKLSSITCGEGTEFSVANNELTLNVKPGDDITCTFVNAKKPAGQVLGASTVAGKGAELPNTGQNPLVALVAGLTLIISAAAVRWFGRKPQSAL